MTDSGSRLSDYYGAIGLNPVRHDIADPERYAVHERKRRNLLEHCLKLPLPVFRQARVLEFGPGSGENAAVLARHGAQLTLVEPLDYLVAELKEKLADLGAAERIEAIHVDVLERFTTDDRFPVVIAEGFVHFLEDAPAGVSKLGSFVAPGGFLLISVVHPVGTFVELLKQVYLRCAARVTGAGSADALYDLAKTLFLPEFERIGHSRGFESWVKDSILNPLYRLENTLDLAECLEALPEFHLYSAWPNVIEHDDLVWHKDVKTLARVRREALEGYHARCPHFLHSRPSPQMERFTPEAGKALRAQIQACLVAFDAAIETEDADFASLLPAFDALTSALEGEAAGPARDLIVAARALFEEASRATEEAELVSAWASAEAIRTCWGSPGHYYVFQRGGPYQAD